MIIEKPCAGHLPARRTGVSLMEILGVLFIIGILASLTVVVFQAAQKSTIAMQVQVARAKAKKSTLAKIPPPLSWVADEHIVIFKAGTKNPKGQAQRLANLCSGSVIYDYYGPFLGCALRIADGTLPLLVADPTVDLVEKNYYFHQCAEIIPTGVFRMKVGISPLIGAVSSPIQNIKNGGGAASAFPVVAVMDGGIDATHPDLNVVFNQGFGQPSIGDVNGHGTHVAGSIAAIHNNFGVVGVAPGAPLWNIRVIGANGGASTDVIAAYQFLAANANTVKVINCSFGTTTVVVSVNLAAQFCVAQGQVVSCSAGNSAILASSQSPGGSAIGVICSAALADSDGLPGGIGPVTSAGPDDTFANFSNYGAGVSVIAPGVDIYSTLPVAGAALGTNYGTLSGTSMSAAHISGLAARILADQFLGSKIRNIIPPGGGGAGNSTPAAVLKTMLLNSKESIPGIFDNLFYPLVSAQGE